MKNKLNVILNSNLFSDIDKIKLKIYYSNLKENKKEIEIIKNNLIIEFANELEKTLINKLEYWYLNPIISKFNILMENNETINDGILKYLNNNSDFVIEKFDDNQNYIKIYTEITVIMYNLKQIINNNLINIEDATIEFNNQNIPVKSL
jgi:hypothetical protein